MKVIAILALLFFLLLACALAADTRDCLSVCREPLLAVTPSSPITCDELGTFCGCYPHCGLDAESLAVISAQMSETKVSLQCANEGGERSGGAARNETGGGAHDTAFAHALIIAGTSFLALVYIATV